MEVRIEKVTNWIRVVNAARGTVNKDPLITEPSVKFKKGILMAEHSPIRLNEYDVFVKDVPYFVIMHLVRHHQGIEKFVSTSRESRTGVPRSERKQTDLVNAQFTLNSQAFINISRKRLCSCADADTIKLWKVILETLRPLEKELYDVCVKECVYRGFCPEMCSCGYYKTESFKKDVNNYRSTIGRGDE